MWQRGTGKVDGIAGRVDIDICYRDYVDESPDRMRKAEEEESRREDTENPLPQPPDNVESPKHQPQDPSQSEQDFTRPEQPQPEQTDTEDSKGNEDQNDTNDTFHKRNTSSVSLFE